MWYNARGEYWWVKIHFKTEQGIKTFTRQEAVRLADEDPDQATRDLFEGIRRGEAPAWKVNVQKVEQSAFSPGNFVPGIGPSPDRMLQARLFSYQDTQRHRLGPNYHLIPVNAPKAALFCKADSEYGERVARGLGLDTNEMKRLAAMTQEERVQATLS